MAQELVSDELWGLIEPLLPPPKPRPKGGRRPVPHRAALTGIVFVLQSGIAWEMLPQEMGCGSGMTGWRRLRAWQRAGVWRKLHHVLLNKLGEADQLDWSRAAIDAASVAAPGGRQNRPESNGSRQIGLEAPSCGRPPRHPLGRDSFGGQRQRLPDAGGHRGCDPADSPATGTPPSATGEVAWRQRLRLRCEAAGIAGTRHRAALGTTRDRIEGAPGAVSLGGGTHALVAEPVSPPEDSLRARLRSASGFPRTRLRTDLLEVSLTWFC